MGEAAAETNRRSRSSYTLWSLFPGEREKPTAIFLGLQLSDFSGCLRNYPYKF